MQILSVYYFREYQRNKEGLARESSFQYSHVSFSALFR